jgi:hypothetical protein
MMLKILKLFGIDVHAKIAEVQAKLEQRVDQAKDHLREVAWTAAVVAALCALAGLAVLGAFGVGLIALYRSVLLNYGQFYGLAAVAGVLIVLAIILLGSAFFEAKASSRANPRDESGRRLEEARRLKASTEDHDRAVASAALHGPPIEPAPPPPIRVAPASAADLVEPLSLILSRVVKFPATGNPLLDELLGHLRGSAHGVVDEAVDGVAGTVRYGERATLVGVLGSAVLVGWLLARSRPDQAASA